VAVKVTEIEHKVMSRVRVYEWTLTDGETGDPIEVPQSDVSVEAVGTFGGATFTLEGSMTPDPRELVFVGARDQKDNAISLTVDGIALVLHDFYRMRPKLTGGAGASVRVRIICT